MEETCLNRMEDSGKRCEEFLKSTYVSTHQFMGFWY